ncbi:MAG: DUF4159 domain-containing protein [Gammaproteobacteria bacterium]|nr:DUF4159 domain-containing protein [Gammaproteobacteria bacterium]
MGMTARFLLVAGTALLAGPMVAQEIDYTDENGIVLDRNELWLTRIQYDSMGGPRQAYYFYDGRWWERWETDFPQAEQNFAKRLNELTSVVASPVPLQRRLTDPHLGDSPLIFMSDVGYMELSKLETDALRTYLANGGFLWVDDFWGDAEWASLERAMSEVLPGKRWITLPIEHPIFHTVFDIEEMPQIPARDYARWGRGTTEPSFEHRSPTGSMKTPSIRAYTDDDGRLMVIATHNTDIADGWERESYGEWYFENFSTKSYRVGINVIVYALSH